MKEKFYENLISIFFLSIFSYNLSLYAEPLTIKVGAILPMSGNMSHIGEDIVRGMSLAIDDKKSKSLKITLKIEDDQFNPRNSLTAATKLISNDKVDVLISLWDMADVVAPLAEKKKVPHIAIRWNPEIAITNRFTFTFEGTYFSHVREQIKLYKEQNVKTIVIISQEAKSNLNASKELFKKASKADIQVLLYETFLPNSTDLRTIVAKAIKKNPDSIFLAAFPPDLERLIKRVKESTYKGAITGFLDSVNDFHTIEGATFINEYNAQDWFKKKFLEKYGEPFRIRAPHGYDIISLIYAANKNRTKKIESVDFLNFLKKLKNFNGATGNLNTSKTKSIETEFVAYTVKDGNLVKLQR